MRYFALSNRGMVRGNNEDFYHIPQKNDCCGLFIVADGMGGANAGEVASSLAVAGAATFINGHYFDGTDYALLLRRAFNEANKCVFETACSDSVYHDMGSTLVCALIAGGMAYIANVGDSRCYILNGGSLKQISKDHSFVQEMIDKGMLSASEAVKHPQKNLITRAIGVEKFVQTDVFAVKLCETDKLLLASDGLTGMVSFEELEELVKADEAPEETVKKLIKAANDAGGNDNITAILVEDLLR